MKVVLTIAGALLALGVLAAGFVWSGTYDIGADDPHTRPVYALLETLRERSIESHSAGLSVPDLTSAELIRSGAGNYDAMCTGCHLAPGMNATEISKGLYPSPPNFTKEAIDNPAEAFWAIKHGIKATGMPAWGKSMQDEYIWGLVAFVRELPKLNSESYEKAVATSEGHSHGGGESEGHTHEGEHEHQGGADDHGADESQLQGSHAYSRGWHATRARGGLGRRCSGGVPGGFEFRRRGPSESTARSEGSDIRERRSRALTSGICFAPPESGHRLPENGDLQVAAPDRRHCW